MFFSYAAGDLLEKQSGGAQGGRKGARGLWAEYPATLRTKFLWGKAPRHGAGVLFFDQI